MRRPLCALALLYAVLVFVTAVLTDAAAAPVKSDGFRLGRGEKTYAELSGIVAAKETRTRQVLYGAGRGETEEIVRLTLEQVRCPDGRTPGRGMRVLCDLPADEEPLIGEELRLCGKLARFDEATNPGMFDARRYYRILDINYRLADAAVTGRRRARAAYLDNFLYAVKRAGCRALDERLPPGEAGLMKAVLFGVRGDIPRSVRRLYQAAGISHIIAISGLHVSFLGLGLFRLLGKAGLPEPAGCVLSTAVLLLYGRMTGFSPSAARAVFMFILRMTAVLLHRTYDMMTAASASLLILLAARPLYILHTGFLFSYAAVFALGYLVPALPRFPGRAVWGPAAAVMLGTLPLYAAVYYTVPAFAFMLNLLVVPLLFAVMAGGLALAGSGMLAGILPVLAPAAAAAAILIRLVLRCFEALSAAFLAIPGSTLHTGNVPPWKIALYLFCLAGFAAAGDRAAGRCRFPELARAVFLTGCVLLLILHREEGLRMIFLDVGQGDGILITGPEETALIDGGSSTVSGLWEYRLLPALEYCGADRVDTWLVTHSDLDHCSGLLELLEEKKTRPRTYPEIGRIVLPDIPAQARDENYEKIEKSAAACGIPVVHVCRGDRLLSAENGSFILDIVHPEKGARGGSANEMSTACYASCGGFRAFLAGDLEKDGERDCVAYLTGEAGAMPADLLKVGHHGSAAATGEELLSVLTPETAVISCGRNNFYGHPHADVLKRLEDCGAACFTTPDCGAVTAAVAKSGDRVTVTPFIRPERRTYRSD